MNSGPLSDSEDEERVVAHTELVDGVEQATHVGVGLRQHVGKFAVAGLALEFRAGEQRVVRHGQRQEEEKRLAGLGLTGDEIDATANQFAIDQRSLLQVVDLHTIWVFHPFSLP